MPDDRAVRERALDPCTSFIVQAPAGSGKTELLIQRYLRLLETVQSPNAVVAITFTKKAAGEMRARVVQALRRTQAPDQPHELLTHRIAQRVLAHQKQLGWDLAANPGQIRMETIDALCAAITRQMPWLSRFGAPPEITEKAAPLYRDAARRTLHHVEAEEHEGNPGPIWRLLLHLDNNYLQAEKLIAEQLEKRDQWLRLIGVNEQGDFAAIRRLSEQRLTRLIDSHLEEIHRHFDRDLMASLNKRFGWTEFPQPCSHDLGRLREIASWLLTTGKTYRKDACKIIPRLEEREQLKHALQSVAKIPEPAYADRQWLVMESVLEILPLAVAELQNVFRHRGVVDFAELSIRALGALGRLDDPSDLALALGDRMEHLLVDEFQDTSYTQFELLEKLTTGWETGDGRTLFLVGDPMQSIYRFRQADVSLFLKARETGIGNVALEPLQLQMNFRSLPAVIAFVNHACGQAFPEEHNVEAGAIAYSASQTALDDDGEQAVYCHAFVDQADEARKTIELLKTLPQEGTAILVRARSHLFQIVKLLRSEGIPFQAVEIDNLEDRPVIQDLLALTYALLHPADRISWLAVLRAPWCGLTLADLHTLASEEHRRAIWDLLDSQTLSDDGQARFARIRPVLAEALAAKGRAPLRDWVEETWHRLGGSACVREASEFDDAAAYFELLETMDEGGDLQDFGAFRDDVGKLFAEPDPHAQDGLQVMTIHKAKGLEFDAVIIPGMGQQPKREDGALLRWVERDGELVLSPMSAAGQDEDPIYRYLGHWEKEKVEHETCRLLYVEMTRARKRLHLLGCMPENSTPKAHTFLKLLWPAVGSLFVPLDQGAMVRQEAQVREMRRVAKDWVTPPPPTPVQWTPISAEPAPAELITYEWVGDTLRHIGTAVHQYLQRIARQGLVGWDAARVKSLRDAYRSVLANLGVPPGELNHAAERVESGLLAVLADERGRWILGPHAEAECEYPVTGLIDGGGFDAVIDRTFLEDGVRWIVDYKTSLHSGGKLEKFYDEQVDRYREQLERYARLLRQREDRPVKLGLYFPLLGGWRAWDAQETKQRQARFAFDA